DDAWVFETNDPVHLQQVRNCSPAHDTDFDGLAAQTKLNSASAPLGRFAQWRFDAPDGTSLSRLRMWRYIGKQTNDWELYTRTAGDTKLAGSDCALGPTDLDCQLGPGTVADFGPLATTSLRVGIACHNATTSCSTGTTLHDAWSAI